jgi:peptidoglycan/LPS O-acetylase OafA/YrhL
MSDYKKEVPELLARLFGHLCGLIFIFLATFCAIVAYKMILKPGAGAAILLLGSVVITYFFGSTAFKLHSKVKYVVVSRSGMAVAAISVGIFSLSTLLFALVQYHHQQLDTPHFLALILLSLAAALFSYAFLHHVKRHF